MGSYDEYPPHTGSRGPVACVWTREIGPGDGPTHVVPDGCVDLIRSENVVLAVGPDTAPRLVPGRSGDRIAGVRLNPGGAGLLFGEIPTSEVRDLQVDLVDLWDSRSARVVAERADAGDSALDTARALEYELLSRSTGYERDMLLEKAVAALDQPAPPSVRTLADALSLSERQLRRRCTDAVGYGPKTLESVLRFRRATRLADERQSLAELAIRAGYADQAHLSREVRRLSGKTPNAFFRRM